MPYFRANKLSDIQDVFTPYPLEAIDEIKTYYQNTTEARTGDIYGGFVEKWNYCSKTPTTLSFTDYL